MAKPFDKGKAFDKALLPIAWFALLAIMVLGLVIH